MASTAQFDFWSPDGTPCVLATGTPGSVMNLWTPDGTVDIELLYLPVSATRTTPYEAKGHVTQTTATDYEARKGIAATRATDYEALAHAAATGRVTDYEALKGIHAVAVTSDESLKHILATGRATDYEALARIVAGAATDFEALSSAVTSAAATCFEAFKGIHATGRATDYEALASLASAVATAFEALAGVAETGTTPYEALAPVTSPVSNSATTPYEVLARILAEIETPYEAKGSVSLPLAWNQFYNGAGDLVLTVRANIRLGEESGDYDAPIRLTLHRTLDTLVVEYRTIPPAQIPSDRPILLEVPLLDDADLATLQAMRDGGAEFGWRNAQMGRRVTVVVAAVESKRHAGAIYVRATLTLQPV